MKHGLVGISIPEIGDAVGRILSNVGDRYVWGGGHGSRIAQENFDCSGGVRKWCYDITGEDIGPVVASSLASGAVASRYGHQRVEGGAATLKSGQAGYWAYTGGSGRGQSGNHCGFWFMANGELHVIHAKGRKYGVVLLKGPQAEKYIDDYVLNKRGGRIFSLGTVSDIGFKFAKSEFDAKHYGNGIITICKNAAEFIGLLNAFYQTEEQRQRETKAKETRQKKEIDETREIVAKAAKATPKI